MKSEKIDIAGLLDLDPSIRKQLWECVFEAIESYTIGIGRHRVTPEAESTKIRELISTIDFKQPDHPLVAFEFMIQCLWRFQTHAPHPRYFGLFNPAPTTMSIAADAVVAAFNPQLASWSHSPYAVEVEQHLIRHLAGKFGYDSELADGTFASGGSEANQTAILTALTHAFPDCASKGLRGLRRQPVMYVSVESHHSFIRAARACGLGTEAVRQIPVDDQLQMNTNVLAARIARDYASDCRPFLITATAGTTNAGVIDPLLKIAKIAEEKKVWFHVDAAWGGAVALLPESRDLLAGIERSDSITFDAHKWLSVPMGAGLYLTRHRDILSRTFQIEADYLKPDGDKLQFVDPFTHSMQCSRRFIGLKLFLSLAVAGWNGYAEAIRHQMAMGDLLRRELLKAEWDVVNHTKLPLVCFRDCQHPEGKSRAYIEAIARGVVSSGEAWISSTLLNHEIPVLRACITNYRTRPEDIQRLIQALEKQRQDQLDFQRKK